MAHTKLFAAVAAIALALTAGASTARAFAPEHPNAHAVENCDANVAKQFELGLTGGNGAKAGVSDPLPLAPTNCNKFFGAPGHGESDAPDGRSSAEIRTAGIEAVLVLRNGPTLAPQGVKWVLSSG